MSKLKTLEEMTEEESIEYSVCAWARALQITNGAMQDAAVPLQTFHDILPKFTRTTKKLIEESKHYVTKRIDVFIIHCGDDKDTIRCEKSKSSVPYFQGVTQDPDALPITSWHVPSKIEIRVHKDYDFHIDKYNLLSFFILMYLHNKTENHTIELEVNGLKQKDPLKDALKMRCIWAGMNDSSFPKIA